MAKKKLKPVAPVFKVKTMSTHRFTVKVPKLPKFRTGKFKF